MSSTRATKSSWAWQTALPPGTPYNCKDLLLPHNFQWSRKGTRHVNYSANEPLEGQEIKQGGDSSLGFGANASVSRVLLNGRLIARKRMRKQRDDRQANEARLMVSLKHRHVVELVGTCSRGNQYFILLYPVADCNLRDLMKAPLTIQEEYRASTGFEPPRYQRDMQWESTMKHCFGCIAAGLAYIHSSRIAIKHKDIKPENILISGRGPLIADFGISNTFQDYDDSGSDGYGAFTPLWAAPEVRQHETRGRAQDVYSLGLVFNEMLSCICGVRGLPRHGNCAPLQFAKPQLEYPGTEPCSAAVGFGESLGKLIGRRSSVLRSEAAFTYLIELMTAREPMLRPGAEVVWKFMAGETYYGEMCGECCR
ncbi:MAG: hypothetical protein M1835_000838 [Candelina submexicana]|nr:MAG: hypothetical protein M1835_000838 [Candelina submexicana]